jgi:SNF2 family DNA or RNA helicase
MSHHLGRIQWYDDVNTNETTVSHVNSVVENEIITGSHRKRMGMYSDEHKETVVHLFKASELNWEESGKLIVLSKVLIQLFNYSVSSHHAQILPAWKDEGHKVLLFSQTQSMLNIVELLMKQYNFKFLRLDGSTPVGRRDSLIEKFNREDGNIFAMLLTTRAGSSFHNLNVSQIILHKED